MHLKAIKLPFQVITLAGNVEKEIGLEFQYHPSDRDSLQIQLLVT
jgi:hypothetical protein